MRRHVNDATGEYRKQHRVAASYSQLAIRITEALTNNVGRIEITCLATIPARVEPGEQYADYKTSLIKRKYPNHIIVGAWAWAKEKIGSSENHSLLRQGWCRPSLSEIKILRSHISRHHQLKKNTSSLIIFIIIIIAIMAPSFPFLFWWSGAFVPTPWSSSSSS